MSIADALKAESLRDDPLFHAARRIAESDLPPHTAAGLVAHISNARTKHPLKERQHDSPQPYVDRSSRMAAVASKVANAMKPKAKS